MSRHEDASPPSLAETATLSPPLPAMLAEPRPVYRWLVDAVTPTAPSQAPSQAPPPAAPAARTRVTKTLWPGQPGTLKLQQRHGDALLCVRYRHDADNQRRYTTVEIIVDEAPLPSRDRRRRTDR